MMAVWAANGDGKNKGAPCPQNIIMGGANMRRTKIVATLGPSTEDAAVLRQMLEAGMNVARFNFSHGDHETIRRRLADLRGACEELGCTVAALADTKGPEIRLGTFAGGKAELSEGQPFILTSDECEGDGGRVSISYAGLPGDIEPGARILVDDGLVSLRVEKVIGADIHTVAENGGTLRDRKSVNVPSASLNMPFISARDRSDLRFIVESRFDFIAASFTRDGKDVLDMRDELRHLGCDKDAIKIIAKIENAEGVANLGAILDAADGLMVARGDLGVEMPLEDIPVLQKELIKLALKQGKVAITATQMLESMVQNPRPTRAEVSDVANAIFDGTGAIMLSGETASGSYPVEAVRTMAAIAERTEREIHYKRRFAQRERETVPSTVNAIAHATVTTAHDLNAEAIMTITMSGSTARNISKFRPECGIVACTADPRVQRQLAMEWGVTPLQMDRQVDTDELFKQAIELSRTRAGLKDGDLIVITAGVPLGASGATNLLKVHEIGETDFFRAST